MKKNSCQRSSNNEILYYMIGELSSLKYAYRCTVEGCYNTGVQNFGIPPAEDKEAAIDRVIEILDN